MLSCYRSWKLIQFAIRNDLGLSGVCQCGYNDTRDCRCEAILALIPEAIETILASGSRGVNGENAGTSSTARELVSLPEQAPLIYNVPPQAAVGNGSNETEISAARVKAPENLVEAEQMLATLRSSKISIQDGKLSFVCGCKGGGLAGCSCITACNEAVKLLRFIYGRNRDNHLKNKIEEDTVTDVIAPVQSMRTYLSKEHAALILEICKVPITTIKLARHDAIAMICVCGAENILNCMCLFARKLMLYAAMILHSTHEAEIPKCCKCRNETCEAVCKCAALCQKLYNTMMLAKKHSLEQTFVLEQYNTRIWDSQVLLNSSDRALVESSLDVRKRMFLLHYIEGVPTEEVEDFRDILREENEEIFKTLRTFMEPSTESGDSEQSQNLTPDSKSVNVMDYSFLSPLMSAVNQNEGPAVDPEQGTAMNRRPQSPILIDLCSSDEENAPSTSRAADERDRAALNQASGSGVQGRRKRSEPRRRKKKRRVGSSTGKKSRVHSSTEKSRVDTSTEKPRVDSSTEKPRVDSSTKKKRVKRVKRCADCCKAKRLRIAESVK